MDYSSDPECSLKNNSTYLVWVTVWKVALNLWLCQISVFVWQRDATSGWQDSARTSQTSCKNTISVSYSLLWYSILQNHSRHSTVKVFIEGHRWKVAGWKFLEILEIFGWLCRPAVHENFTFSMYDSNCHKQSGRHDLNRQTRGLKSGSNRDTKSEKACCLGHLKHLPVLGWCKSMVSRRSYQGKIDCKKGDLRRYRCNWFAWLCK